MFYKATLDSFAQAVSVIIALLCALIGFCAVFMYFDGGVSVAGSVGVAALLPIIVVITYLFSVKGYTLSAHELRIARPIGAIIIARSDIKSIDNSPVSAVPTLRVFGSGGLFGYFGVFYNQKQGRCTLYATNMKKTRLLILQNGKKIGLSPNDAAFFDNFTKK